MNHGLGARARLSLRAPTRRVYLALAAGRFAPIARIEVVQRLRRRWQHPIEQSDVLEILGALATAGVQTWLAGGWGVDALVGAQTREHKDLDLVVDGEQLAAAFAALHALGFRRVGESEPGAQRLVPESLMPHRELVQDHLARTVDLHPVEIATWPGGVDEPFATGTIGEQSVDCLSLGAQAAAHQGFELAAEHQANLRCIERVAAAQRTP
jgi:lincosamide nucleotidyltransferase A/C/D/E